MNRNNRALWPISLLAFVGMVVALYDSISRIMGIPLFCPFAGNGCDTVQNSPYAVIFGIPLAFLGVLGFGGYLVLAYLGRLSKPGSQWYLYALLALNVLTHCAMAYFSYLELAVIHAVCSLCVFAAVLNVALGVTIVQAVCTRERAQEP